MMTMEDALVVAKAAVEVALFGQVEVDTAMALEALPHNPNADDDLEDRLVAIVNEVR